MKSCVIYTDGACLGNPGPGGWAAHVKIAEESTTLSGGEPSTTNNRMEIQAVISALAYLPEHFKIDLYTDSRYVINGISDWMQTWSQNNWKTANRKPVKNKELWQELQTRVQDHSITWHWVKGHSGNQLNELVDQLAREEAMKFEGLQRFDGNLF